ncbi:MAG: efflux RND transporter periplasmic adaptor subunit [Planctomycetes bacterium]|nr:efflux RND transporter periplasmic adaptor subunit [Planctomycetota bacterium]
MRICLTVALLATLTGVPDAPTHEPTTRRQDPPIHWTGLLLPSRTVTLGFSVEGRLAWLGPDRGDRVTPGQRLAKLESEIEESNLQLARARAEQVADVEIARVTVRRLEERLEQMTHLFKKGAASQEDIAALLTELELARLDLTKAEEERHIAELEAERALHQLLRREIVSTVSGVVIERHLDEGELTRSSSGNVLTVAVLDPLEVELILPASWYGRIERGQSARVSIDGFDGPDLRAEITGMDGVIDARSGTFGVRLSLPNPEHRIPAGMECRVEWSIHD